MKESENSCEIWFDDNTLEWHVTYRDKGGSIVSIRWYGNTPSDRTEMLEDIRKWSEGRD